MSDALTAAVRKAWAEASAFTPGSRAWRAIRIAAPGPLTVLAGIRESDTAKAILFETPIENAPATRARFEADGIAMLEERNYPERTYRVSVTLERSDLDNIFCIVTADLIEAAGPHVVPSAAVANLFSRLSAWQAFLRARRSGLGREAVIGLIGELLVLRRLAATVGWTPAVDAWKGPTSGLHDFLRKGSALEVKSSAGVASVLEVSSLDQLEDTGLTTLVLAHVQLAEGPGGFTLPALVASIRDDLSHAEPPSVRLLGDALLAAGYADVDAGLYLEHCYQPLAVRFYRVEEGFPRLTRAVVPEGITEARYRLDLRALQPHLADDGTVLATLRQMGDT